MAKVKIDSGNARIAGEYELDIGYFTNRELHLIKKETGVRAGEYEDAIASGDTDLAVGLAFIALQRHGKLDIPIDALWEMEAGKIIVDLSGDEEEDALPPESEPAATGNAGGPTPSSSETSSPGGEASPEPIPLRATGSPG